MNSLSCWQQEEITLKPSYLPSSVSVKSKIKQLCRALVQEGQSVDCVEKKSSADDGTISVPDLETTFWEMAFRYTPAVPSLDTLENRITAAIIDRLTNQGSHFNMDQALKQTEKFRQEDNSFGELVLDFLLDLGQAGQCSPCPSANATEKPCMRQIFNSLGGGDADTVPASDRPSYTLFRSSARQPGCEAKSEISATSCRKPKSPPARPETAPLKLKRFVGECLLSPEIQDFHVDSSVLCGKRCRFNLVTAERFLEEISRVAMGRIGDSGVFAWDETIDAYRLEPNISVLGYSMEATENIGGLAGVIGSSAYRIHRVLAYPFGYGGKHPGRTLSEFLRAVKNYLGEWTFCLMERLKSVKDFLQFALEIEPLRLPIQFADKICSEVFSGSAGPICGITLVQVLYSRCLDVLGLESLLHLALYLLEETAKPFFTFATALAVRGEVCDPYQEFGITINQTLLAADGFWDGVLNDENGSSFLSDFIQDTIRVSKSLFLLRLVCPYHPMLPAVHAEVSEFKFSFCTDPRRYREKFAASVEEIRQRLDTALPVGLTELPTAGASTGPAKLATASNGPPENCFPDIWTRYHGSFSAIVRQELLSVIDFQVQLADSAVVKLFQSHLHLANVLKIFKDYFFLENGEFSSSLVSSLYDKAASSSLRESLDFCHLATCFDNSISESSGQLENLDLLLLNKLTLMSTYLTGVDRSATSFDISDYLGLQYKIDWPLSMIITSNLTQKCNSVLQRLLRIRSCTWVLNEAFVLLSEASGVENHANRCVISVYRHEMAHFIGVLDGHLRDVAIRRPWLLLQSQLAAADCWEKMRDSVAVYMGNVYDLCVLSGTRFSRCLRDIFRLVTRFYTEIRSEASFEAIDKTFGLFQHCVFTIQQSVETQTVPLSFDVDSFLAQLDFNSYIRSSKPLTPRIQSKRGVLRSVYGTL